MRSFLLSIAAALLALPAFPDTKPGTPDSPPGRESAPAPAPKVQTATTVRPERMAAPRNPAPVMGWSSWNTVP